MPNQQLNNQINEQILSLENELATEQLQDDKFIVDFYNKNNIKNPWVYKDINEDQLFYWALSVMTYFDKTTIPKELYELDSSFFKKFDLKTLSSFNVQLDAISSTMKEVAKKNHIDLTDPQMLNAEWERIEKLINETTKLNNLKLLQKFIALKLMYPEAFNNSLFYIGAVKKFKSTIRDLRKQAEKEFPVDDLLIDHLDVRKIQDESLKEIVQDICDSLGMDDITKNIFSTYQKISNEYVKRYNKTTSLKRKIQAYKELPQKIDELFENSEVTEYKNVIEDLDESIKISILRLIDEYNKKAYQALYNSYQNISNDETVNYRMLFSKYGIEESFYPQDDSKKINMNEVQTLLIELTNLGIKDPKTLSKLVKYASLKAFDKLSKYIKKGIITLEFIRNNPDVFDVASNTYINATSNIQTIISSGITPTYIMKNQDVLLMPQTNVKDGIKTLDEYNLKMSLDPSTPASIFAEENLEQKLDTIIELGYEKLLADSLSLASYSKNDWKKIQLLRFMNIEVEEADLETVLGGNNFIVGQDEIDNYIIGALAKADDVKLNNLTPNDIDVGNHLESFCASPLSYRIGGVLISKNKVERNLKKLAPIPMCDSQKLLLSIGNNLVVTNEELLNIKKELGSIHK